MGDVVGTFAAEALEGLGMGARALTVLMVATHWARLQLWPAHLRTDYSPQELSASTGWGVAELLGLALVLGVLATVWLCRRRAPVVSFGLAWVIVALLPVSNVLVPTGILLAERTAYVRATVLDSPRSFRAQRAHGEVLFLARRRAEGIAAYGLALQYAPPGDTWRVRNDLARRYYEEGQAALAVEQLLASRQESPLEQETWNYLILGYLNLGEYPTALREAEAALAQGFSAEVFGDLRALADTAMKADAPRGSIRVRVVR